MGVFEPQRWKEPNMPLAPHRGNLVNIPCQSRTAPLFQLFKLQPRLQKEKVTISEVMVTEAGITRHQRQQHRAENQKEHPITRPSHRTQG